MYVAPVPRLVPPELAAYQSRVPALAVALKVKDAVPQAEAGVVLVTLGIVLIVATTAVLGDDVQAPLLVSA